MWKKKFRICLFYGIYQYIFWLNIDQEKHLDWDHIIAQAFGERNDLDQEAIKNEFTNFLENKKTFDQILTQNLKEPSKTYLTVKAVLYTFFLEVAFLEREDHISQGSNIVGKYIKLTQEIVGGESTGLVHAITSKVYAEKVQD